MFTKDVMFIHVKKNVKESQYNCVSKYIYIYIKCHRSVLFCFVLHVFL